MSNIFQYAMGVARINDLMCRIATAVEEGDKDKLMSLGHDLMEDTEDFVGVMFEGAQVSEKDIEVFVNSHNEEKLIKIAGSAEEMKNNRLQKTGDQIQTLPNQPNQPLQ